jgi:hypothetical protein
VKLFSRRPVEVDGPTSRPYITGDTPEERKAIHDSLEILARSMAKQILAEERDALLKEVTRIAQPYMGHGQDATFFAADVVDDLLDLRNRIDRMART